MTVAEPPRLDTALRATALLLVVAATAAGLKWALPAAGIGLTFGFIVLGSSFFPRFRMPMPVLLGVVVCCGVVAYLSATRDLGTGYRYIPAVVPFFLLSLAFSSVVHRPLRPAR